MDDVSAPAGFPSRAAGLARWKLTVDDYHRMGEAGILTEDDRVELIEGELIEMAPIGTEHAGTVNTLNWGLTTAIGRKGVVTPGDPVALGRYSEPQPDFTVLKPRDDFYKSAKPVPADVLLMIEVSQSSLRCDRSVKLPLYASFGIPEAWIVDIAGKKVQVCRGPEGDGYADVSLADSSAMSRPLLLPDVVIAANLIF